MRAVYRPKKSEAFRGAIRSGDPQNRRNTFREVQESVQQFRKLSTEELRSLAETYRGLLLDESLLAGSKKDKSDQHYRQLMDLTITAILQIIYERGTADDLEQ
jgi:hypothetical protein